MREIFDQISKIERIGQIINEYFKEDIEPNLILLIAKLMDDEIKLLELIGLSGDISEYNRLKKHSHFVLYYLKEGSGNDKNDNLKQILEEDLASLRDALQTILLENSNNNKEQQPQEY